MPELQNFPIDFTLLFFAATASLLAWAVFSGRIRTIPLSFPVLSMVSFSTFAAMSIFWSSVDPLNVDKLARFLLLTSSSFFAAHTLAQDQRRRERLLRLVALFSWGIVFYYLYYRYVLGIDMSSDLMWGRAPPHGDQYLEYGGHAGILFIVFLSLAVFGSPKQLASAIIGSGAALLGLVIIGGRGPLMVALLAILLVALGPLLRSRGALRRLTRLAAFLSALTAVAMVGYVESVQVLGSTATWEQLHTLDRYELQLSGEYTHSVDARLQGQDQAFRAWQEKPIFGWGIGEFRIQHEWLVDPHNLLLEILMETGLVGAFLFFSVCIVAVADCGRLALEGRLGWIDAAIALLLLTELISHITWSGYLADDRILFTYLGLAIGMRIGNTCGRDQPVRTRPMQGTY